MRIVRVTLLTGLGVALAVAGPGMAAAEPLTTMSTGATTIAEQAEVTAYWTPDRMREATPLDLITVDPTELSAEVATGEIQTVEPTDSPIRTTSFPNGGGEWTGGGDVVTTAGRVFFTMDGRNASCSGNAVTSGNSSTVLTAGHCVKYQGNWHTNWVFVPGYHDGQRPYGTWTAASTHAIPQWVSSEDMNYDVGAAVVNPLDGQNLTDVVGGQGVTFNQAHNQAMYAFGFPAADPYDGEKFIYCSGNSIKDPLLTNDHGLSCDMTGGSSGGPWFLDFDEATGTGLQASVNSFGYIFLPGYMFGPHFGSEAQALYNEVENA
ncbi:V8-like Glu-specific endopeptidase [Stackebrandtia endophytica]|uniref:V8-like Glu-specific endopeptidase n=1 Tax=Stackebrandtia endophytica TaxID=1496996 RepID=A0A543B2N9_9ACTN|nr:peptidase [Stackebrandtia endophytica]TQL79010.1 V8-like Glu-specific endopeptidase [Stackebrandtia endophytica]